MLYCSRPMRKILALTILAVPAFFAQSPTTNILGVWKADLQKSKFAGPPPTQYLEIVEEKTVVIDRRTQEKAQEIDELSGTWGEHGQERELLAFVPNGKPYLRSYEGVPTRITASAEGDKINLAAEVAGRPTTIKRTYELSSDGQTLTIDTTIGGGPRERHSVIVLMKQPDSAGEPLREPEETAGAHFKNVKTDTMKALPASEFIDHMHYFAWSLDKNCEFCHVKGHFDSDDKKEKQTARKMIEMVSSIDQNNFKGRPEVRCFTCHEGHSHPLSHPLFPDEAARLQAAEGAQGARPGDMPAGKSPQQ